MRPTRGDFTITDADDKSVPKEFTVLSKCDEGLPTDSDVSFAFFSSSMFVDNYSMFSLSDKLALFILHLLNPQWDELFRNPGPAAWPDPAKFDPSMIPEVEEVEQ